MDDGYSPINMAILLAFVALSAVLYGFGAAIQHVNEAKLEEEKEKLRPLYELAVKYPDRTAEELLELLEK